MRPVNVHLYGIRSDYAALNPVYWYSLINTELFLRHAAEVIFLASIEEYGTTGMGL